MTPSPKDSSRSEPMIATGVLTKWTLSESGGGSSPHNVTFDVVEQADVMNLERRARWKFSRILN